MKNHKGSKRCMLELISSPDFLPKINSLIQNTGAVISNEDNWLPKGLIEPRETQLKTFVKRNFGSKLYKELVEWWMHVNVTTPTWDFVSTCEIDGKRGIILVEAKAHCSELNDESHGKKQKKEVSENTKRNHIKIGEAINDAKIGINKTFVGVSISIESCYQLSNRVAHAWWLAKHDIPVVLIYLGFLNAEDMNYGGRETFTSPEDWKTCFVNHCRQVGVDGIVDEWVDCGRNSFKLIVRSI